MGETSPTIARVDADWETRGGDVVNDEIDASVGGDPGCRSSESASRPSPASCAAT